MYTYVYIYIYIYIERERYIYIYIYIYMYAQSRRRPRGETRAEANGAARRVRGTPRAAIRLPPNADVRGGPAGCTSCISSGKFLRRGRSLTSRTGKRTKRATRRAKTARGHEAMARRRATISSPRARYKIYDNVI